MSNKSARQALREERARQAARAKRRERLVLIGVGVAVVILIIAIAGIVQWQRSQVSGDAVAPAGVAPGYGKATQGGENGLGQGIGIGDPDAPVVVEVFEDFSCPHCRDFEARSSHVLRQRVASGDVRVVYYPVTLSQFGEPTVRSANAFACAADQRKAREMHDALYANFSQSWSTGELLELGKTVGLDSGSFRSCVRNETYAEWVESIDQTATEKGVIGTPTIFVNSDTPLPPEQISPAGLQAAIDRALKR
ncbi:MAG TPA: thioredoxin domain-containing protein [Actinopolymorphaceae bacterium]|jgi:protein-disulfide isomerase